MKWDITTDAVAIKRIIGKQYKFMLRNCKLRRNGPIPQKPEVPKNSAKIKWIT